MTPAEYIDFDAVMSPGSSQEDEGISDTRISENISEEAKGVTPPTTEDTPQVPEESTESTLPEPKKRRYFCSIS